MMAKDNKAVKPGRKDESQSSSSEKTTPSTLKEQVLKCPRCDSMNTKFCYYNNYSLTQPRHFCKTCRRYWTNGGALRSVPIGGGCRKSKKPKPSSKFSSGFSPAMDFQTSINGVYNQVSSFGDISSSSLMGFNFPLPCFSKKVENNGGGFGGEVQEMGDIASSIESLSCINQDLHWKLQQQRFAILFSGENQKENQIQIMKPQPIMFQNLDISKNDNLTTEWFFDNSYTQVNRTPYSGEPGSATDRNGDQEWSNLNQFGALP